MNDYPYRLPAMRLHDYQKLAILTAPPFEARTINTETDQILHGAIGLSAEMGEIYLAGEKGNLAEEIGDCLWYIALGLRGAGYDMEDIGFMDVSVDDPYQDIVTHSSAILDQAKRLVYYEAPLTHVYLKSTTIVLKCLSLMVGETTFSFEEILERNIAKLKIRYPKKFDSFHATQRNLKAEAKVYED